MEQAEERENRLFPDQDKESQKITSFGITRDFLIFSTDVSISYCDTVSNNINKSLYLSSILSNSVDM